MNQVLAAAGGRGAMIDAVADLGRDALPLALGAQTGVGGVVEAGFLDGGDRRDGQADVVAFDDGLAGDRQRLARRCSTSR